MIGVRHLVRDKMTCFRKSPASKHRFSILHGETRLFRCAMAKPFLPRRTNLKPWWSTRRRIMTITAVNCY